MGTARRRVVFALDADAAGQQQWQALARQAALRGKQVAVLPPQAYGGCKDVSEAWAAGVLCLDGGAADLEGTRDAVCPRSAGRHGPSGSPSWSSTGVSHSRRRSAARGRATRRQEPLMRPAARRAWPCALRAGTGQAAEAGREDGRQRHTNARRQTTMDTDDKLRSIFGNLRGGRLEDVADTLLALKRSAHRLGMASCLWESMYWVWASCHAASRCACPRHPLTMPWISRLLPHAASAARPSMVPREPSLRRERPTTVSPPGIRPCPRMDDGRKHAACTVHAL